MCAIDFDVIDLPGTYIVSIRTGTDGLHRLGELELFSLEPGSQTDS